jgi:hypothetical protein
MYAMDWMKFLGDDEIVYGGALAKDAKCNLSITLTEISEKVRCAASRRRKLLQKLTQYLRVF